jgi:xylan 1,4-beta-xylosidase
MKFKILIFSLFSGGFFCSNAQNSAALDNNIRTITANINDVKGTTKTVWQKCVGAGRANEGLRADWQDQLRFVKKECGFEYIRMHGLLHDDMGVYFEDKEGNPIYNWQYIDQLYDFLLQINVRPFVEFSFMPKALASGTATCFWWKGNVTPPKSYQKWSDLIKALTQHFTDRYGKEEVKKWYFEVWNEPNLKYFFSGQKDEYFKLYDYTARAVKSVCNEYKVGGPATAGNAWIPELIEYCKTNNCPIDIITTHDYAVIKGFLDADGKAGKIMSPDSKSITKNVLNSKNQIVTSKNPNLELHYTEWSTSPSSFDAVHDSYQSAAFILDKIKGTENVAHSMSYWTFTDIFEEAGPRTTPFHGGFGLLNYQSIPKPSFYAYQLLNKLGKIEIKNEDSASWVCKNSKGDIQVLFWNLSILNQGNSINNDVFYKRDLPAINLGKVAVNLSNIQPGNYIVEVYKVGYNSNDSYGTYLEQGSPQQLTRSQVNQIIQKNGNKPIISEKVKIERDGIFIKQYAMRENDVYFISLKLAGK